MTSRNLFCNLMKEDLKRRIWTVALITLAFLVILPVCCALAIEGRGPIYEIKKEEIISLIGLTHPLLVGLTMIGAVVIGLSGFFYLHSRKKVDLYHSIPVRRETLFSVSYINGILIYVVPYIVNMVICFLILTSKNLMQVYAFKAALTAFGVNLLYYCLIYTVTIIAVMMTGNIIVSTLGTGVFLLYGPMLVGLKGLYCSEFFRTFYDNYNLSSFRFSSPVFSYISTVTAYNNNKIYTSQTVVSIIALVVFTGLAVILYKKRPSESAGKSMVFDVTKPVIQFLLVIPIALGAGVILREIVGGNKDGWFEFGLIFALIIVHAFIQVIYNFDIRCAIKKKKELLACAFVTVLIACIFRFDWVNYNTYIPKMKDISYMSVYVSGIDKPLAFYIDENYRYLTEDDYDLAEMKMHNFNAAYKLAQMGIKSIDNNYSDYRSSNTRQGYFKYIVKYTLKNNKTIYRQYCISIKKSRNTLKDIYENKEYKQTHFMINMLDIRKIDQIDISYASEILNYTAEGSNGNGNIYISAKTNSKEISTFMDIYKEELNNLTYEKAMENATAKVTFDVGGPTFDYYIYPSFTKTLAFIQKQGFDTTKTINIDNITKVTINHYGYNEDETKYTYPLKAVSYTDKKRIKELFPLLIDGNSYDNSPTLVDTGNFTEVLVGYKTVDGRVQDFSYYIPQNQMPDYVIEDLKK